jgi:anthranilate synthase component 2
MDVLLLDNGDPKIKHLDRMLTELGARVSTYANDEVEVDDVRTRAPRYVVISTGEDTPAETGITLPLIRELGIEYPILGIGLGMVCIAVAFGARVIPTISPPAAMEHEGANLLAGLPSPLAVAADPALLWELRMLPSGLWSTAWSDENQVMGLAHATLPLIGLLALPSSPVHAQQILRNFLALPRLGHS